jgi:hypothetical protein
VERYFVRRAQELLGAALNRAWPIDRGAGLDDLAKRLDAASDDLSAKAIASRK